MTHNAQDKPAGPEGTECVYGNCHARLARLSAWVDEKRTEAARKWDAEEGFMSDQSAAVTAALLDELVAEVLL